MRTDTGQTSAESELRELHAYAKLLFLRSGRQFEDKTPYRDLEGEISPDEAGNDGVSSKNIPLGHFDADRLRRQFLDRLSETISSTKGGRYVVASHMFYWPDKIKVFIAINLGVAEGDATSTFLDAFSTALKAIAAAPGSLWAVSRLIVLPLTRTLADNQSETHTDALWNKLLHHQSSRLNTAVADVRQIMKNFPHLLPQHSSPETICDGALPDMDDVVLDFEDCLKLLAMLLFGDSDSDFKRHKSLVSLSHTVYRTFPAENFQALGRVGDKLHQAIGFLGRLQTSFRILVTAARQISGFDDLTLIPVVGFKTRGKPHRQEWSLATTFHALNLQLSDTAIDELMRPSRSKVRWTKTKLLKEFSGLKSPTWEVHAEIQLIIFILSNPGEVANGKRFDYIGCSRYSCLLCSKFLYFFQDLKTRGCHGKLYNHSWTVLLKDNLGKGEDMLSGAMKNVISWMQKELTASNMLSAGRKLEAKESTIGSSLITIPETSQNNHQQSYATSEYLHRQRAQNSHVHPKQER